MAKGETKKTNAIIQQNLERDRRTSEAERGMLQDIRANEIGRNLGEYNQFSGILTDRYNTGGLTPEDLERLRGLSAQATAGGGGAYLPNFGNYQSIEDYFRKAQSGGTVDTGRLREGQGTFRDVMNTGGFSPDQLSSIGRDLGILQGFGVTGGLDPYSMDRMRGGGVYEEFANTGGYSDADKALIRDRAIAPISSMFDADRREINRLGRVTGGQGGTSRIAALARSGRERGQAIGDVARTAEMNLADRVRQGRLEGAGGLASSEGALQQLRTGNMLQGLMGSLNFQNQFGQQLTGNRMGAVGALQASELPIQQMLQEEGRWGTGNLFDYLKWQDAQRGQAASAGAANNRAALANEWDIIDFMNQNRQQSMAGMGNLLNTSGNNILNYSDLLANERNQTQAGGNAAVQSRIAANPHWSEVFSQIAGPIAGGVGAVAGAFGPDGRPRRRLPPNYEDQYYGG